MGVGGVERKKERRRKGQTVDLDSPITAAISWIAQSLDRKDFPTVA
jgi:hypothetical protein